VECLERNTSFICNGNYNRCTILRDTSVSDRVRRKSESPSCFPGNWSTTSVSTPVDSRGSPRYRADSQQYWRHLV